MITDKYSAGLMSQSFWFAEFKKLLKLKNDGQPDDKIKEDIIQNNLFGLPNEYRAKRVYGYLLTRVNSLSEKEIGIFFSTDVVTQKIIDLVCILRNDRLFFEFLNEVYREKIRLGTEFLEASDTSIFWKNKEIQSADVAAWNDSTKKRISGCYFNFMTDANLLTADDKKRRTITPPIIDIAYERLLTANGEGDIIRAMTGVDFE